MSWLAVASFNIVINWVTLRIYSASLLYLVLSVAVVPHIPTVPHSNNGTIIDQCSFDVKI